MVNAAPDEQGRLHALRSYGILDTPRETDFDLLARLIAQICETPIATVTLVDARRQWFKAAVGLDLTETDRAIAICAHAIRGPDLFVVPDARLDPLFASNPLVTGDPGLRFYAGMPLVAPNGFALGTIAVMDRVPRTLSAAQTEALRTLGRQVMVLLELRLQRRLFEHDHTARRQSELEHDKLHKEKIQLLECTDEGIWQIDTSGRCTFANGASARMLGYEVHEMLGMELHELIHHRHADGSPYPSAQCPIVQAAATGRSCHSEDEVFWRKDSKSFPVKYVCYPIIDAGNVIGSVVTFSDISERKAAENEIRRLAFNDPLTRLPNRQLLLDRLQHALAICSRSHSTGALLFIDLDNFKTLNETLGHQKGDQLLQQVALRLAVCVRTSDTVARLGGDEFVVMLEDLGQIAAEAAADARGVAEKILSGLNLPYQLTERWHFSSPSIGVALFGAQHADVGELLKHAELAMYQAKAAGRNTIRFFDPEMQTAVTARAALESDLRDGLRDNQFLLHFQPQVDGAGRPIGAEALVRWRHPRRGLVSPGEFIPLAEDTGLILPLGQWVLESACTQLAAWAARPGTAHLTLAVNVSARQFRHAGFIGQVLGVLERTGADPRRLKLELTEGSLIDDIDDTIATMIALKAKGVGFSLDDFGTGYSSLAYLKRLPLDQLKIDQSFVRDVLSDANDATIARTIVTLGQSLGLAVIAEGVETEAQRDFLARHNCDAFQGYLFSRPLTADQFDAFIRAQAMAHA